jgi:hypothetical protein
MSNLPRTIAKAGESTAAGQQHQAHPPLLERRAELGASVPEGVPDRLGTQRRRPGPVKVDVDGAVTAAADVLADALADVLADVSTDLLSLAHGALRLQPLAKIAVGMTGRVPPSRREDFAGSLICHRETPDYC